MLRPSACRVLASITPLLLAFSTTTLTACVEPGSDTPSGKSAVETTWLPALKQHFPERAEQALQQGSRFVEGADFIPITATSVPPVITLPKQGGETIRLRGRTGATVNIRELDSEGAGKIVHQAVAYPRRGGASFWTAAEASVEEWLYLEASAVHASVPVARWEVENATLRQRNEIVDVVDADGITQLSVFAPDAFAEGNRRVDLHLSVRGSRIELFAAANNEALWIDPLWVPAAPMSTVRILHTSQLLQTGKLLVAGGNSNHAPAAQQSAELYDVANNTWLSASVLAQRRYAHTTTMLADGRVLVVAGRDDAGYLASAEVYDPVTNTWASAGALSNARAYAAAALLPNGNVLVVGGSNAPLSHLSSSEIYDPTTNTWSAGASLLYARESFTATLLPNGKVLASGGFTTTAKGNTAEILDPTAGIWSLAAPMSQVHYNHTATLLSNGKVLVAGGSNGGGSIVGVELYDPVANIWAATGNLINARASHAAVLQSGGQVMLIGGSGGGMALATTEVYDLVSGMFTVGSSLAYGRFAHAASLLSNGEILVTGGLGTNGNYWNPTEIYSTPLALGSGCANGSQCASGFCVDQVCCNSLCNAADCDACSVAKGADMNGTCKQLNGLPCNDFNSCTNNDVCQAGVCSGTTVVCQAIGQCFNAGVCNPATGCSNPPKVDGSPCDDGDPCTQGDTCQFASCAGGGPLVCAAQDQCHEVGSCDVSTGACSNPAKADGVVCDDGNSCTQVDACQAGQCAGENPVVCTPENECHDAGTCDPQTGTCDSPNKADGTPCPSGTCEGGVCVPKNASSSSSTGGAGMGGAGGSGGSNAGGAGEGGSAGKDAPGDCGCRMETSDSAPAIPFWGLAVLLFLGRRKGSKRVSC